MHKHKKTDIRADLTSGWHDICVRGLGIRQPHSCRVFESWQGPGWLHHSCWVWFRSCIAIKSSNQTIDKARIDILWWTITMLSRDDICQEQWEQLEQWWRKIKSCLQSSEKNGNCIILHLYDRKDNFNVWTLFSNLYRPVDFNWFSIDFSGFRILEVDSQRCLCEGVDNFLSIILLATSSCSDQTTITWFIFGFRNIIRNKRKGFLVFKVNRLRQYSFARTRVQHLSISSLFTVVLKYVTRRL